ncbi:tail protein [Rhizocola hellebori]|uniref:Tail protein n=1 Tax=Rhizocola hellebori TaxID=1392758 RepID=A0A8J3VCQ1_9ACTN|nr:tail fiber protein [Rhizocola hellebori]GIH02784.1 tail protein [Rhizocola hellebori]
MTSLDSSKPVVPVGDLVIGTVVPFSGPIGSLLEDLGWFYCDGRAMSINDYTDLFEVIGKAHGGDSQTFNLPDYRGYLLRGVDDGTGRDPDAGSRKQPNPGGATGDAVGSMQGHATALPTAGRFTVSENGSHSHTVPNIPTTSSATAVAGSYRSIWNSGSVATADAGEHYHQILQGGDAETRPGNAYVNYIIRART